MGRARKAWFGALVAVGALGLLWVSPLAAVIVSFLAFMVCFGSVPTWNLPVTRAAALVGALAHAAAVYGASRSALLAGSVLCSAMVGFTPEALIRRLGYGMVRLLPFPLAAAAILFVLAWPVGAWRWAGLPLLLVSALLTTMQLVGRHKSHALRRSAWNIQMGEAVPEFELVSRSGEPFRLSAARGRYVLLCFVKGDWCPVCHVKMRIYQQEAPVLARANVKLVVISPSTGEQARDFARDMGVDALVLEDKDNQLARTFGALELKAFKGADAPLPVSFLIDPEGKLCQASRPDDLESFMDPRRIIEYLKSPNARSLAA